MFLFGLGMRLIHVAAKPPCPALLPPALASPPAFFHFRLTDRFANLAAHLLNAVAQCGGPFEIERLGRRQHFDF